MLNIPNGSGGVQEVLLGEDPRGIICAVPSSGLHVLAANPRSTADVYEILTSPTAAEQIARLAQDYDHVIIDTPPTLAFPDALVWAKLADAVVLISYAGQTTAPELKETKERFARVRARVLGAVLSNVPVDQGLYRYGHSYRTHSAHTPRKARTPKKLLLPTHAKSGEGGGSQT
jgi:Mrp family chromosome partitioning ATPase